ncbi:OmpP1/FadL family transporter [Alkanindiges sp. WGS2144]|uniref:putative pilus system OmpP1/FadL family transporter FilD n=1 Tax=Alkanindiges sp. WGS2144 TaxID=3366808 RepID=UPI00375065CA
MKINLRLRPLSCAILLSSVSALSHAQLGQNLSIDIRALSMGNAVTADPPGISAIHFNPAGLTKIQGLQTDVQGLLVDFNIRREFEAPPGYNVFGYSDDPLICNEMEMGQKLCGEFKDYAVSKVDHPSLYVPVLKKIVNWPQGLPLAAPLAGAAYNPPGSKITYASGLYAPLVAGFGSADGDPGNYMGQQVAIERITYLSPSAAYKVNDHLSLGASVGMSYQAIGLKTDLRFPNELIGVLRLIDEDVCGPFKENGNIVGNLLLFGICNAEESIGPFKKLAAMDVALEQSLSPTYNLGLLWEPNDDFGFGMVYQSSSKMKLKGKYAIDNGRGAQELIRALGSSATGVILQAILGFPSYIPPTESGIVSMDLEYPAHFQAGIKYKVMPDLQFNFDIGWTDYAAWDSFKFNFDRQVSALKIARLLTNGATPTSLELPLGFRSPWSWGVGMEYSATDRLKLRLGYEPRKSAIPDDRRNTLVPINNAQMFGAGIGYQFDPDTTIDLTAMHLRSRDNIPANTSGLANKTGVNNLLLNPYAGLDIKTNTKVTILGIAYRTVW